MGQGSEICLCGLGHQHKMAKLHMEPPWVRGIKCVCVVLVTSPRWLPCPYMVKTSLEPMSQWPLDLICSIWDIICSLDDPGLTMTCFMSRSSLAAYAFVWENVKTMDFSGTIIDLVMKFAPMGHNDKKCLLTSYSHLLGVIHPCPWAIYMYKTMEKIVKNHS